MKVFTFNSSVALKSTKKSSMPNEVELSFSPGAAPKASHVSNSMSGNTAKNAGLSSPGKLPPNSFW